MTRADHSGEEFFIAACECGVRGGITEDPAGSREEAFCKERFGPDRTADGTDLRSGSGGFPDQLLFDGFQCIPAAFREDLAFAPEQVCHLLLLEFRLMARQPERENAEDGGCRPGAEEK